MPARDDWKRGFRSAPQIVPRQFQRQLSFQISIVESPERLHDISSVLVIASAVFSASTVSQLTNATLPGKRRGLSSRGVLVVFLTTS
jgi:hypothetical protein